MNGFTGFYPREQGSWRGGGMSELLCGSRLTLRPFPGWPSLCWLGRAPQRQPVSQLGPHPALAALLLKAVTP